MLTEKDICMIMPTYNRPEDIDRSLNILLKNGNVPGKLIIIDQSRDDKTRKVAGRYMKKLNVEYIHSDVPSSSISANIGIKKARKKFRLILTIGDDIDFLKGYLKELLKEFNDNPEVMGLGGVDISWNKKVGIAEKVQNILKKLFFLPLYENQKFKILGPYGNTSSQNINNPIRDAQWLPGANMCFQREIYTDYLWPEIRGYNLLEDIDCSYRVYRKYGAGSIVITPKCKVYHRYSHVARYDEKKRIFANHEDHFAFYYRHFNNLFGTFKLIISLIGIIVGNLAIFYFKPSKYNFLRNKYNIEAIIYCYNNREYIKNNQFRRFLNDDLSMKEV